MSSVAASAAIGPILASSFLTITPRVSTFSAFTATEFLRNLRK